MSDTEDTKVIQSVSTKLPAFNSKRPDLWFCQVEAEFDVTGVKKEETKYSFVVKSLTPEAAIRLEYVLKTRPTVAPYETLKKAILQKFTPTEAERLEAMWDDQPLGDMKPSDWAAHLQSLLPTEQDAYKFFVKNLFLRRLPPGVRRSLAREDFTSLHELSDEADKLWASDKFQSAATVEVQATGRVPKQTGAPSAVGQQRSATTSRPGPAVCWRHKQYGDRAHKCEGGSCTWPKNGPVGSSN